MIFYVSSFTIMIFPPFPFIHLTHFFVVYVSKCFPDLPTYLPYYDVFTFLFFSLYLDSYSWK